MSRRVRSQGRSQSWKNGAAVALATLGAVTAFGAPNPVSAADPADPATIWMLSSDGHVIQVSESAPTMPTLNVAITGVATGQSMVGIDVRPQNGALYGVGYDATAKTMQLYRIALPTGVASAVGGPVAFVTADGTTPDPIDGPSFGVDFNPSADRLRVVSSAGENFRINPNTGAAVDGDLGGGATPGVNMDGALNGGATGASATAYTNSAADATVTTQYTLSAATDSLYIQNPPNAGTLTSPVALSIAGSPADVTAALDIDIRPGVDAASNGAAATGSAYGVMTIAGTTKVQRVNLATGAMTTLDVPAGITPIGIALSDPSPYATALSANGTQLVGFDPTDPGTVSPAVTITGVNAGETIVGIDARPATGQLIGVGVNATANTATIYVLDPRSGAATAIGAPGALAWVDASAAAIDLPDPATTGYGIDVNPTVDRVRIVTGSGLNLRANPVNGTPVDGDSAVAGVNPDGAQNALPVGSTGVSATAYTNSYAGATVTTQYTLDATSNKLLVQNPPNTGTQSTGVAVTLSGSPLDFSAVNGFDIASDVGVTANSALAHGYGYATLTVGGTASLYRIDLSTGAATAVGAIGGGAGASGFALWTGPQDRRFVAVDPIREIDTRSSKGGTRLAAGQTAVFTLPDVPATATAATLNVTVDKPTADGFLTVFPCGPRPETSSVNYLANGSTPNQVTVGVVNQTVCVFSQSAADVIIDLNGWDAPDAASSFSSSSARIWDSRTQDGFVNNVLTLDLTAQATKDGVLNGLTAVSMNVTATEVTADAFVTVYPCNTTRPLVSNANPVKGGTAPNHVTVAVPADHKVCVYTDKPMEIVVDLTGWWSTATPGSLTTYSPVREFDSRLGSSAAVLAANTTKQVIAPRPGILVLNATVASPSADGWLAVFPCATGYQGTSTVNYVKAKNASNATLVDASTGVCVRSYAATDVVIDSTGIITGNAPI